MARMVRSDRRIELKSRQELQKMRDAGKIVALCHAKVREMAKPGITGLELDQAIRQFWIFSALLLDAFAVTGQSLVGYFVGSNDREQALRVAQYVCGWSLGTGMMNNDRNDDANHVDNNAMKMPMGAVTETTTTTTTTRQRVNVKNLEKNICLCLK